MAKTGMYQRQVKREKLVDAKAAKRAELKAAIVNESLSFEERMEARDALNKLPKDSSQVRLRNRCVFTGRPRGVYRKFKMCRVTFREMASRGQIPGVTKASW